MTEDVVDLAHAADVTDAELLAAVAEGSTRALRRCTAATSAGGRRVAQLP